MYKYPQIRKPKPTLSGQRRYLLGILGLEDFFVCTVPAVQEGPEFGFLTATEEPSGVPQVCNLALRGQRQVSLLTGRPSLGLSKRPCLKDYRERMTQDSTRACMHMRTPHAIHFPRHGHLHRHCSVCSCHCSLWAWPTSPMDLCLVSIRFLLKLGRRKIAR